MRNLIRQVRRQPGFHTINEDNNPNATRSLSDREFLLGASKRDGGDSSLQDNTTTFVRDMCIVIRSCWKSGLLVGSCCGMLAFAVVILQSHDHGNPMRSSSSAIDKGWMGSLHGWMGRQPQHSSVSVATSRPIPTAQQQASMRDMYMRASVTLVPSEKEDTKEGMKKKDVRTVVLQGGSQKAGDAGHINLPLSFYEGIHFGVSAWNPWANVSSVSENSKRDAELRKAMEDILISDSSVVYNAEWRQKERIAYNKNKLTPVQETAACNGLESQIMDLARSYQQFVVYKWFPYMWGSSSGGVSGITRPHHHTSILQSVVPTRTGLSLIRTKTVVYEAAITGPTV